MSVNYTGQIGVVRPSYGFSQRDGWIERYEEEGTPSYINGRISALQSVGFNVQVSRSGPYATLRAAKISYIGSVPFVERWWVSNEILTKDIFTQPWAQQAATQWSAGAAKYRQLVKDVADGKKTVSEAGLTGNAAATLLIQELSRGADSYETEYVVLKRERTEDASRVSTRVDFTSNRYVFTTAQLNALYAIPDGILFSLPSTPSNYNPALQPNTMWGWRIRDQEADITADYKVTTRESFLHAEWSTFLYRPYA